MSFEVTATRKRPRVFDELTGQEFVVSTLKNSISRGQIAHSYLFAGPRGVGKTSAARILAASVNCPDGPSAEGCPETEISETIAHGSAMDVIEIDGASNTSVNDVRQIKDEVLFAPNTTRYKVYIIDEVHMLSNSAFNALLKTIEEPPPYIIFIFATTEIHKVPATIRSRCQQFNFRLIPLESIKSALEGVCRESGLTAEDEALYWIAKEAQGSLRDAYTLFDQIASFSENHITFDKIADTLGVGGIDRLNEIGEAVVSRDAATALETVDGMLRSGISVEQVVTELAEYFRNLLFLAHGVESQSVLGFDPSRYSQKVRGALSDTQLERAVELLTAVYRSIRYSLSERFELELAVSRLATLPDYLTSREIVARVNQLRQEIKTGAVERDAQAASAARDHGSAAPRGVQSADAPTQGFGPEQARGGREQSGPRAEQASEEAQSADDGTRPAEAAAEDTSNAGPPTQQIDDELVQAICDRVRESKPALASNVEKATRWLLGDEELTLYFDTDYAANAVKQEQEMIRQAAEDVLDEAVQLLIRVEPSHEGGTGGSDPSGESDEQVELVRHVFRGEVIDH